MEAVDDQLEDLQIHSSNEDIKVQDIESPSRGLLIYCSIQRMISPH